MLSWMVTGTPSALMDPAQHFPVALKSLLLHFVIILSLYEEYQALSLTGCLQSEAKLNSLMRSQGRNLPRVQVFGPL